MFPNKIIVHLHIKLIEKINNPMFYSPSIVSSDRVLEHNKISPQLANLLNSTNNNSRKRLEQIRKGLYANFHIKMKDVFWKPDYGPNIWDSKKGVTIIGARNFLLAYNINHNNNFENISAIVSHR
mgnify:CR=1 FL=1